MEHREEELIRQHLTHDEDLQSLYSEHQELKRKLEVCRSKHYLTTEEEIEEKRIQKLKLASKDRMREILGPLTPRSPAMSARIPSHDNSHHIGTGRERIRRARARGRAFFGPRL